MSPSHTPKKQIVTRLRAEWWDAEDQRIVEAYRRMRPRPGETVEEEARDEARRFLSELAEPEQLTLMRETIPYVAEQIRDMMSRLRVPTAEDTEAEIDKARGRYRRVRRCVEYLGTYIDAALHIANLYRMRSGQPTSTTTRQKVLTTQLYAVPDSTARHAAVKLYDRVAAYYYARTPAGKARQKRYYEAHAEARRAHAKAYQSDAAVKAKRAEAQRARRQAAREARLLVESVGIDQMLAEGASR